MLGSYFINKRNIKKAHLSGHKLTMKLPTRRLQWIYTMTRVVYIELAQKCHQTNEQQSIITNKYVLYGKRNRVLGLKWRTLGGNLKPCEESKAPARAAQDQL